MFNLRESLITSPKLKVEKSIDNKKTSFKGEIKRLGLLATTMLTPGILAITNNSSFPEPAIAQTKTEQPQTHDNTDIYLALGTLAAIGGTVGFLTLNKKKNSRQETALPVIKEEPANVFKPEILTLEELFATESFIENRNTDFYKTLLKRYAIEIETHIKESFATKNSQGADVEMKSNAKLLNLIFAAKEFNYLSDDFTISHLHELFANGLVEYKEINGVPVLIINDKDSMVRSNAGGVMIKNNGLIRGIIKFNPKEIDSMEISEVLKHEFVHVAVSALIRKFKLDNVVENKPVFNFINEFLAYGATTTSYQFTPEMICTHCFYVNEGDNFYERYYEISKQWSKIYGLLCDEKNDPEGKIRNKIKSYLINKVKLVDDLDFDNIETKSKFESHTGISIDISQSMEINWDSKILKKLTDEDKLEFESLLGRIDTQKILRENKADPKFDLFDFIKKFLVENHSNSKHIESEIYSKVTFGFMEIKDLLSEFKV